MGIGARLVPEGELQDPHPGEPPAVAQGEDLGSDVAQVFGDEGEGAQRRLQRLEEAVPGTGHPAPARGVGRPRGDFVIFLETAEMVQPDDIGRLERRAHPLDPPAVPGALHLLPTVERVPPELPGGAEIIGGDAGNGEGKPPFVQVEERAVGPDVGAVMGDKNREVADDADPPPAAVGPQFAPLPEELELDEFLQPRILFARNNPGVPLGPGRPAVGLAQRGEPGEGIEPSILLGAEAFELRVGRTLAEKRARRRFQQPPAPRDHRVEIDTPGGKRGMGREVLRCEEPPLHQGREADQQGIPRHSGIRLVGGVPEPGRTQGEDLPQPAPALREKVGEAEGLLSQVTDAEFARERGGVKQDAALTHEITRSTAAARTRRRRRTRL